MNKVLFINLQDNNSKIKQADSDISQKTNLFDSHSINKMMKPNKYNALFSKKEFFSKSNSYKKFADSEIKNNYFSVSGVTRITANECILAEKEFNSNDDIKSKEILKKSTNKDKNKIIIKCLDKSMKIMNKISNRFHKSPIKSSKNSKHNIESENTADKTILAQSQKRMEIYKNLFKSIKDNFSEIKSKLLKKNIISSDKSIDLDNDEINEEGFTNIKNDKCNENAGRSINEYSMPYSRQLYDNYDSCNLPDYLIQEDSVNKPDIMFSRLNNKLSTIDLDFEHEIIPENTINQFDVMLTNGNTNYHTKQNTKINYDEENCFFFKDNEPLRKT